MTKIWAWLHSSDAITWAGHGLQGFVIVLVADVTGLGVAAGVFAVVVHFGLRELPGLVQAAKGDTKKFRDGLFDLMAPIFAVALYALLLG
jgi:hypothetical protein